MKINDIGGTLLQKIPYSVLEKIFRGISKLFSSFGNWCKTTVLGNFVLSLLKSAWIVVVVMLILVFAGKSMVAQIFPDYSSDSSSFFESDTEEEPCTVVAINVHGQLVTYIPEHAEGDPLFNYDQVASEYVTRYIRIANEDPLVKAIIIEVDSGGGSPVAGEEIANAIKNSEKPVIAFIRAIGASASYWAISSASKIFASQNSDIGSIGVTMSYLNNVEKNSKDGYTYEQLNIGKYKDAGSPDRALTKEERELFLRDANILYENFIQEVSKNRNIPIQEVKAFADGSTVLGLKAKEYGLIDEIGGPIEVKKYVENLIGEKPEICWR